jgi:poly(3-hydroxybutyrate) depolymerase
MYAWPDGDPGLFLAFPEHDACCMHDVLPAKGFRWQSVDGIDTPVKAEVHLTVSIRYRAAVTLRSRSLDMWQVDNCGHWRPSRNLIISLLLLKGVKAIIETA